MFAILFAFVVNFFLPLAMSASGGSDASAASKPQMRRFQVRESLASEQVTITGRSVVTHGYNGPRRNRMSVIREALDGHQFAFLMAELASLVVIRRYDTLSGYTVSPPRWWRRLPVRQQIARIHSGNLPKSYLKAIDKAASGWWEALTVEEKVRRCRKGDFTFPFKALKDDEFAVRPTVVLPTSKGAVAVWLFDETDGELVPRTTLDGFTKFKFASAIGGRLNGKLFKRPSLLFVRSYFKYSGRIRPASAEHEHGAVRILFREEQGIAHDGVLYISEYLHFLLLEDLLERARNCKSPLRQEKLYAIAAEAEKSYTWSSVRIMTQWGLLKGDAVVCVAPLPQGVDVLCYKDNLKPQVFLPQKGTFVMSATPKKQVKSSRSNRQVISMVGPWLFGGSFQPLIDELERKLNRTIERLEAGEYIPPVDSSRDSAHDSFEDKARFLVAAGLRLGACRYLTGMLAGSKVNQMSPPDDIADKKRRFPVPNAVASSMHTPQTWEIVYGKKCPVKPSHVILDTRLGWIPAHDIVVLFFAIAGGADSDDVIVGYVGFANASDMFFRITKGSPVAGFQRDPMTAERDVHGNTGVEIQVWQIDMANSTGVKLSTQKGGHRAIIMPNGRPITTVLDIANRPMSVAELGERKNSFTATSIDMPEKVTYEWLLERIEKNRRDPLGRYMNILMAFMAMGWPFEQVAAGEDVVDACQQYRNPKDFVKLEEIILDLQAQFRERVLLEQVPVDYYVLKSAGMSEDTPPHLVGKGSFTFLVEAHKQLVADFEEKAGELYAPITEKIRSRYPNPEPKSRKIDGISYEPGEYLARLIRNAGSQYRRSTGVDVTTGIVSQGDREEFGDWLAESLINRLGKEELVGLVRSMYVWAHRQERQTSSDGEVRGSYPERFLFWGGMFYLLIEALTGNAPEASTEKVEPFTLSGPSEEGADFDADDLVEEDEQFIDDGIN